MLSYQQEGQGHCSIRIASQHSKNPAQTLASKNTSSSEVANMEGIRNQQQ